MRYRTEDHPRRCGENLRARGSCSHQEGSPPQVRGKLFGFAEIDAKVGITPAGAGKTKRGCLGKSKRRDHPRRCGENAVQIHRGRQPDGSPPQVRGKQILGVRHQRFGWITPAGAGKTIRMTASYLPVLDHPRRCGENSGLKRVDVGIQGSPPQVRGKPCHAGSVPAAARITPAGAGKTELQASLLRQSTDHPRRCGENAGAADGV